MNRLLYGSALCVLGCLSMPISQAYAAACTTTAPNPQFNSSPGWPQKFGAFVETQASSSSSNCVHNYTDFSGFYLSEEVSEAYTSKASEKDSAGHFDITGEAHGSASISNTNVFASVKEYNATSAYAGASSEYIDLIWIENPTGSSTDITDIPVEFCGALSSEATGAVGSNSTALKYSDYHYGGEHAAKDYLSLSGGVGITHTANGEICRSGHIRMAGKHILFVNGLYTYTIGNQDTEVVNDQNGNPVNIQVLDARIEATFKMDPLPAGYECYSASGSFPGCDRKIPESMIENVAGINITKEKSFSGSSGLIAVRESNGFTIAAGGAGGGNGGNNAGSGSGLPVGVNAYQGETCPASKFVANPINFALGVKHQSEVDYAGGTLSFARFYRSDSTWTADSIGKRWRHNFDRTLNVINGPESTTADITDASGAMIVFREDSSGDWHANDDDVQATFESVLNGSSVLIGYIYTTNADTKEHYDIDGKLTRIEYRGSQAVDLEYDVSDRLETVSDQYGQDLTLSYDASDRVSSVVTPAGTFSYTYDTNDNLETVTNPDNDVRTYHYEDTNHVYALTGITDEESVRYATWAYDTEGRAISSEHAGGVDDYTIAYNTDGTTTTTNPLGKDTTYTFATFNGVRKITNVEGHASTNCAAANKAYEYDANGFMTSKTDWLGNVTEYERNDRGLVTSMTEAVDTADERTTTYTYETSYRLPDFITETGRTVDYDYDSDARMTSATVTDIATSEARTTTYSYNASTTDANGNTVLGRMSQMDGPRTDVTDVTTYTYDANLRMTKVTNALGHEYETTSFDSADRPLTVEDADNVETTFVYDVLGRVTSSTRASGTALAAITTYAYDDVGNLTSITSPNGVTMTYTFDNARRLTGIEDALGNTITYTHDAAGNITSEEYDDASAVLHYSHTRTYDELSRLLSSVDANTDATDFDYDVNSNLTEVTDAENNATQFAFDALDRLVEATDALSGVTGYTLNDLDQLEDVTDPRSNTTSYSYNAFGDITQEVSPDRGTISYVHDKAGNVTSMTDARSVVTNYSYDALNRLSAVAYPGDTSLNVALTYDSTTGCGTSLGKLCSVSDAAGSSDYVYDDLGRLTSVTETRGALSFTTSYSYDLAGALTGITLPSGRDIDYTLNGNAQVSGVSAKVNSVLTTLASGVSYLPFGAMEGMTYGNAVTLSNSFNTAYQLTNRTIGSMMNENFTYDNVGNITAKGSDAYTYDDLYRLTEENADDYTYDAIGNRLTKNTDDYTYPATSSKLSDVEGDGVTYDASGNITDDDTRTYAVNDAGQIESISIGGSVVGTYTYDANNLRTKKVAGGVTTHYVYGGGGLLYGEYDNSGNLIREYVYLNGEPLAQIDDVSSSDVLTYLHTDHLATPRYASNTSGTQVWAWDSDAFGNGAPTGTATVNLRFPGQYFDSESDLHYNWNRYYNPETGRYVTSDPIGLDGGLNTYGYANASPVMFVDPEGLKFKPYGSGDKALNEKEITEGGQDQSSNCTGEALCEGKDFAQEAAAILTLSGCYQEKPHGSPKKVGDIAVYGDFGHIATVTKVDSEGNVLTLSSKFGSWAGVHEHHPTEPLTERTYGVPTAWYRVVKSNCCYNSKTLKGGEVECCTPE